MHADKTSSTHKPVFEEKSCGDDVFSVLREELFEALFAPYLGRVDVLAHAVNSRLTRTDSVALASLPNCSQQARHTDIPTELASFAERPTYTQVPFSVIVALQPNVTLEVWPRGHRLLSTEDENAKYAAPLQVSHTV